MPPCTPPALTTFDPGTGTSAPLYLEEDSIQAGTQSEHAVNFRSDLQEVMRRGKGLLVGDLRAPLLFYSVGQDVQRYSRG